jgi:hypothetical protein
MSVGSDGRLPNVNYLVDQDGRVYDWTPDKGWIPTNLPATHEAVIAIRTTGAPVAMSPETGEQLYRDPTQPSVSYLHTPTVPRVNGLAKTARVFSWLGLLFLPFGIIGLILGYMALSQIAKDDAVSRSVARTAIIVGWIFTVITVILVALILHG